MTSCIRTFSDIRGEIKFISSKSFLSYNKKNVLRGIHKSPYGKIITCLSGKITDYIIKPDYSFEKYTLIENNTLYIPPDHGHLFISLEDNTVIHYQLEGLFDPEKDININYLDPYINLDIPKKDYIISDNDKNSPFIRQIDYVILGGNGFLGSYTYSRLITKNAIKINTRLENVSDLYYYLSLYKPKYVINAAGISGKPTIKWCEDNQEETIRTNLTYQLTLADICNRLNIHLTFYGSGMVYKNDQEFDELEPPNNYDSFYSKTRILLEKSLLYKNILYLRIMYPIIGNGHEKCFLSKCVSRRNNIHDKKVSITVFPSIFDNMISLIENKKTGIFNLVNGQISIPEILLLAGYTCEKTETENEPNLLIQKLIKDSGPVDSVSIALKKILLSKNEEGLVRTK